jgi:tetratricopeptide (TPR) repeat protein
LKHYPDHGETLCMKGLLVNSLGQKEEALKLAKDGLKRDLKSHVCWHVLGLIYRSDRNYAEATKCYKTALRWDPGNSQIMRDLSFLQLHERDLVGYTETRRQLLAAKPAFKQNWLSFMIAEHLRGAPAAALEVIDKMDEAFVGQEEPMGRVERSEMILYKASLCVEAGKLERAVEVLGDRNIVDSVGKNELLLSIYYQKGEFSACKKVLTDLLKVNLSHEGYFQTLVAVSHILDPMPSPEQVKQFLRLEETGFMLSYAWESYDDTQYRTMHDLKSKLSASDLITELGKLKDEFVGPQVNSDQFELIVLGLLPADSTEFASRLRKFVLAKLNKGVPSTFKMLRRLCQSDEKKKLIIGDLLTELSSPEDNGEAAPVMRTFALASLASFHDFNKNQTEALKYIEEAIQVTPTLIDLYVLKAKMLKHAGDVTRSAEVWEFARNLDLADRYLNSKAVKAMLRVEQIDKAKETIVLFGKDATDPTKTNLSEMQCMWWEFELGKALAAKGDTEGAREVWKGTLKHYEDMAEDEFDFAIYCLRKMTLRAYIDFLRFGQRTKTHKFYTRTVEALAKLDT